LFSESTLPLSPAFIHHALLTLTYIQTIRPTVYKWTHGSIFPAKARISLESKVAQTAVFVRTASKRPVVLAIRSQNGNAVDGCEPRRHKSARSKPRPSRSPQRGAPPPRALGQPSQEPPSGKAAPAPLINPWINSAPSSPTRNPPLQTVWNPFEGSEVVAYSPFTDLSHRCEALIDNRCLRYTRVPCQLRRQRRQGNQLGCRMEGSETRCLDEKAPPRKRRRANRVAVTSGASRFITSPAKVDHGSSD
jgi:hypothetical protein